MKWLKSFWEALSTPMDRPLKDFTPRATQSLALARKEAARFHHNFVGTEDASFTAIAKTFLARGVHAFN